MGNKLCPGVLHLLPGLLATLDRYRTCCIRDKDNFKTIFTGVQHGCEHTYIFGKAADPKALYAVFVKMAGKPGLVEGRVLILVEPHTFSDLYH